ncbi:HAD family hydrolase [Gracilibacillus sp. HCP3S3_G5_1]|uniref:HAD family hydrolase n=1 Tax=unclassified Gracilibacillus TaxID=2625209 RepID=UPI003F8A79FA
MGFIKAVVFDLDGTLLDRETSINIFIEKQYNKYYKSLKHIDKDLYIARFIELDNKGKVWKDKVYQQLKEEFQLIDVSSKELLHDYITYFRYSCIPFPNLHSMLESLKNMNRKLGMITNGKGAFQQTKIIALKIESFFSTILISVIEGIRKPNREIFERAMQRLQVEPHECVFVGDHPQNDIIAARNAGMLSIWKNTLGLTCECANFTIDDLNEIPIIIRNLTASK